MLALTCASAHADEGLARISELGDRDLVAQSQKAKAKPKAPKYTSVEDESESSTGLFKGNPPPESSNLFFGFGRDFWDAWGLQGRFAYRVLDKGFVPELNNSIYLEGGVGMTFYGSRGGQDGVTGFSLLATVRWDFQLNDYVIFFADLGAGYTGVSNSKQDFVKGANLWPALGVGAIVNVTNEWAVRGDLSYQFLGVGLLHRF
ncbi:MAG: hypothetical protein HY075_00990 [Deltaproteobacteria bacterium]|nr:hypothetical protein [Deltaproteobacteria bacterium]